jgi:CRP-like cAMP-binding protein
LSKVKFLAAEQKKSSNMLNMLDGKVHLRPTFKMSKVSLHRLTKRNKTLGNKNIINKKELEEEMKRINRALRNTTPYELCINALSQQPEDRSIELNKRISFYLRGLKKFMNILSNEDEEELENVLYNISSHLKLEKYDTNQIICKYGDTADKFYIILKGKVVFLVPKQTKHYLAEDEYILYLLNLKKKGELEIMKKTLINNQLIYYFGDNLDEYILNCLERHEKHNENIYSKRMYNILYEYKEYLKKEKNGQNNEKKLDKITIDEYIGNTVIRCNDNPEYARMNGKKLVSVFEYQRTNIFKDGDSFGSVGANSKSNKRTATSLCFENCELGCLTKDEYISILENVNSKARNHLYELTIANKIFVKMPKHIFINKYIHMFHFVKYYKDDLIMSDTQQFNKLLILYAGEFVLSLRKNLIELNDLIAKVKKIRAKMLDIPEDVLKKDLTEINENKLLLVSMKYSSSTKNEIITKRQNYIIAKVKENLVLGLPNSVDPDTYMPLFNCICASNSAIGYKVDNDMLKLMEKANVKRTIAPPIIKSHIELFLGRLLDIKKILLMKINYTESFRLYDNIKNKKSNENNTEDSKEIIEDKSNSIDNKEDDANVEVPRNFVPKMLDTSSVLFDFNKIKISDDLEKFTKRKKINLSPIKIVKTEQSEYKLIKDNTIKNFFSMLFKYKKNILEKKKILRSVQKQSHKFMLEEKTEQKKIQINLNKLKSKEEYNDFSLIFAKYPYKKKTILDKFTKKLEDNVLDPLIKDIKKQLKTFKTRNSFNKNLTNNNFDNKKVKEKLEKFMSDFGCNTDLKTIEINNDNYFDKEYIEKKTRSIKLNTTKYQNKNKLTHSQNDKDFKSFYTNTYTTTDKNFSTNQKSTCYSNKKNLTTINLNDIDISQKDNIFFNNKEKQKDLFYMFYYRYILDELNNKNPNKRKKNWSINNFRTLNSDNKLLNNIKSINDFVPPIIGNNKKNKFLKNEIKKTKETI